MVTWILVLGQYTYPLRTKYGSLSGCYKLTIVIGNNQVLNRSWELVKSLHGLFPDILMLGLLDIRLL